MRPFWSNSAFARRAASNPSERHTSTLSLLHESGTPNRLSFEDDLGVILFEAIVNGRPVWAILDNGAANTIIDTGLARELNMQVESVTRTIRTTHSQTEKFIVNGVRLDVPGQFKIAGNFAGADLATISEVTGKEVGLILGPDIPGNLSYLVDAKNNRMIFFLTGVMNPSPPESQ